MEVNAATPYPGKMEEAADQPESRRLFTPPSVLPDISPSRGEISSFSPRHDPAALESGEIR
ncbi:MAG TPA: hypothetical protein VFP43_15710, partial [Mesorhizobium sp.]|nr:hypothetical protein [Mesorhizobium sp.]